MYKQESKRELQRIIKLGHKPIRSFWCCSCKLSQKYFVNIIHSFAHLESISFDNVMFDFEDIAKVNSHTRFTISKLSFNGWIYPSNNFLEKVFKTLSSNKSLCESLTSIEIQTKRSKQKEFERLESKLWAMGFRNIKLSLDLD